jgi:hypothetical protein
MAMADDACGVSADGRVSRKKYAPGATVLIHAGNTTGERVRASLSV